jgi:acyl-coenzyme A synthetase/AMP-(fatty) acid ligase
MNPVTGIANPVELLLLGHDSGRRCAVDRRAGEVTYADMLDAVREYAGRLQASGVRPGCRAAVVSDDSVAAIRTVFALWWHGCVPILLHPMLRPSELGFILRDSEAEFVELNLTPERRAELRDELDAIDAQRRAGGGRGLLTELISEPASPPAPSPAGFRETDEVLVQYTSGSTGRPRGVRHCMKALHAVLRGVGSLVALTPDDIVLSTAKLSFGYGFGNSLLFPFAAGACSVLLEGPADAFSVVAALGEHRPTVLFSVPRLYAGMIKLAEQGKLADTSSLRLAVATGEHLPSELAIRITETFDVPLINGFGATEVLHTVVAAAVDKGAEVAPGSIGVPVPGVTATIRDDAGRPVGDEVPGRLHLATPSAGLGYINRPEDSARTFADGGVYTGDVALRTATGELRHVGRVDDMLLMGGYKIAPAEIEGVVRGLADVADCAVVGSADATGLEQATVYVVARAAAQPDAVAKAVRSALRDNLAPYKRPSRVEVIDELPVTANGKLARFQLRDEPGGAGGTAERRV